MPQAEPARTVLVESLDGGSFGPREIADIREWMSGRAVMYGDRRPYPVVLITLDPEEILPWAKEQGLPEDMGQLAEHDTVKEIVQAELDRANANYAKVEQVKKFKILDHDLSIETGELTPTLKVKRNIIYDRYEDMFEAMYSEREKKEPEKAAEQ